MMFFLPTGIMPDVPCPIAIIIIQTDVSRSAEITRKQMPPARNHYSSITTATMTGW